jgi:hypothetical protein
MTAYEEKTGGDVLAKTGRDLVVPSYIATRRTDRVTSNVS